MPKNCYKWKCDHDSSKADKFNRCNICRNIEYRKTHKRIIPQTNRDRWMRSKRGISEAAYNEQLVKQNGVCAICKKPEVVTRLGKLKELAIDHDHKTNKFRALLCQKCNVGLGHFDDSPELLITAAQYLKSFE